MRRRRALVYRPAMARPTLRLPWTAGEKALEVVALAGVAGVLGLAVVGWRSPHGLVPTHFGIAGRADAWGGRWSLLVLPAIALVMYVALTLLARVPHQLNYLVQITERNAAAQYRNARSLLLWTKAELAWLFAYLSWQTVGATDARSATLGSAFLPVVLLALGAPVVVHAIRSLRLG